jgi:hypothetical protein
MTFTHEGNEYQIITQIGTYVQITKAFRMLPHNFVEMIIVDDFKNIGVLEVKKVELHIQDIEALAVMLEVKV